MYNLPPYQDQDQDQDLSSLIQMHCESPTTETRNELVLILTRPALKIARSFRDTDDCKSEALMSLIQAVDRFPAIAQAATFQNLKTYVFTVIRYHLRDFVKTDTVIPVPPSTRVAKLAQGKEHELPVIVFEVSNVCFTDKLYHVVKDILFQSAKTAEDLEIIRLFAEQHIQLDIARIINRSVGHVNYRLKVITTHFMELWNDA